MNIVLDTNCPQDHHYDVLKQTPFPFIDVIDIDEFVKVLKGR